jgi:hypothetical protein
MKSSTRLYAWLKFLAVLHITEQLIFGMQDLHDLQRMIAVYDRWTGNASAALALLAMISTGLASLVIRGILKGGSARFAAMFILGLPTIGESHHLVETMRAGHYVPGSVTAVPSVICGVLFLQRLTREFRSSRTSENRPSRSRAFSVRNFLTRLSGYFGAGLELPMSTTTFQEPSFCFFQMDVYLP